MYAFCLCVQFSESHSCRLVLIPLDKFKKSLGKKVEFTLNEEEILKIREVQDLFAEAICNMLMLPKISDDINKNDVAINSEIW